VLCPSFYRVDLVRNPSVFERFRSWLGGSIIIFLQGRAEQKRRRFAFNEIATPATEKADS